MTYKEIIKKIDELRNNIKDIERTLSSLRDHRTSDISSLITSAQRDPRYSIQLLIATHKELTVELNKLLEGEI